MKYLAVGYMWLYVHRPFEVWPWLGELQVERLYMILLVVAWITTPKKSWPSNLLNPAVFCVSVTILLSTLFGLSPMFSWENTTESYCKVLVFYIVLVSTINNRDDLRFILFGFLLVNLIYFTHNLREFLNGRGTYRMGIFRMNGVDLTNSHPNSLASTAVYALPFVIPFFRSSVPRFQKVILAGFVVMAIVNIVLTGSRTGFVALLTLAAMFIAMSKKRILAVFLGGVFLAVLVVSLPDDKKDRYLTLFDSERGPKGAQESAEGRMFALTEGYRLFLQEPILGYGPGGFKSASGTGFSAHNLYGEIMSELGLLGVISFSFLLIAFTRNVWQVSRVSSTNRSFEENVVLSVGIAVITLLVFGMGAHNAFRYNWLWFAAFQIRATDFALGESEVAPSETYDDIPESQ